MKKVAIAIGGLVVSLGAARARAAEPGFVEDFNDGTTGFFLSFATVEHVESGGVGGADDGFLRIAREIPNRLGAHSGNPTYLGDLIADGVTGFSFWLNDIEDDEDLEIHVGVGSSFINFWITLEGFSPPEGQWAEFSVDITDASGWVQVFGDGTFAEAVAESDKLLFRHDNLPIIVEPDQIAGTFGLDRITVLPACALPAFVAGEEGVSFDDRAFDGFIDARAESSNGVDFDLGLDTFTLEFTTALENADGSPLSAAAFTVSDTGGAPPGIANVTTADGQTVTLELTDHITLQERTTIAVNARAVCNPDALLNDSIEIGYLPANVNQDNCVTPFDLLQFRQYVNGDTPPVGVVLDYIDTNRDGESTPFDLLWFRQLINGIPPSIGPPWAGQCLP